MDRFADRGHLPPPTIPIWSLFSVFLPSLPSDVADDYTPHFKPFLHVTTFIAYFLFPFFHHLAVKTVLRFKQLPVFSSFLLIFMFHPFSHVGDLLLLVRSSLWMEASLLQDHLEHSAFMGVFGGFAVHRGLFLPHLAGVLARGASTPPLELFFSLRLLLCACSHDVCRFLGHAPVVPLGLCTVFEHAITLVIFF